MCILEALACNVVFNLVASTIYDYFSIKMHHQMLEVNLKFWILILPAHVYTCIKKLLSTWE